MSGGITEAMVPLLVIGGAMTHAGHIPSDDSLGASTDAWIVPADSPRGVVLVLAPHHPTVNGPPAAWLRETGYASLLIDLQATGGSQGSAIASGCQVRLDGPAPCCSPVGAITWRRAVVLS
jgi:hypothetical protein